MIFLLNKSMKMVSVELAEYYSKDQSDIDLDTIIPYLLLVIIQGITEVNQSFSNNFVFINQEMDS